MKRLFFTVSFLYLIAPSFAQSYSDIKMGLGFKHLTNRYEWNIMVPALEGEYTRKLTNLVSASGALGIGYGKRESMISSEVDHHAFLSSLDASIFLSPFGNDKKYNLKLGTGASVLYASEWLLAKSDAEEADPYNRVRAGVSIILENEWHVGERGIVGIKTMAQPYLKQEFMASLLIKYGRRL